MSTNKLIRKYEALRSILLTLDENSDEIDAELAELEKLLPGNYEYPGDPTLEAKFDPVVGYPEQNGHT